MNPSVANPGTAIEDLQAIRDVCPALREVFLPDHVWPKFKLWHQQYDRVTWHRSILLSALEGGHLGRLTSPIHRYLIYGSALRPELSQQYIKDLPEDWMHYSDPLKRHKRSKEHSGRVAELQCAEWLETRGWTVVGLEALRVGPDIDAKSRRGSSPLSK